MRQRAIRAGRASGALRVAALAALAVSAAVSRSPGGSAAAAADAGPAAVATLQPFVRVVGTVQDGGLPHAGCSCTRCEVARRDPSGRRQVASLALVSPANGRLWLIDATPDLERQLTALRDIKPPSVAGVDRSPVDGVLLTHAHIGHYLGLAFLGFEVLHTRGLPVFATPRMTAFLRANAPWEQLVRLGNIELREVEPGTGFGLAEDLRVTPLAVPHRDEYSDTVGYLVEGPRRRLLYVPDTDSWAAWEPPLSEVIRRVDVALLDGTFFSLDELPGREVSSIGHPLITRTVELLGQRVASGAVEVFFTHLNHSNPALDPESEARSWIEERGFAVLREGQEFPL